MTRLLSAFPMAKKVANVDNVIDDFMSDWLNVPSFFRTPETGLFRTQFPAVDIDETDDKLSIVAELPGMKRDDIQVVVHEGVLTISGERKEEKKEESDGFSRHEIMRGSFKRAFTLPKTVNVDKIVANYEDGLLKIEFPKIEAAKPKHIEVKVK